MELRPSLSPYVQRVAIIAQRHAMLSSMPNTARAAGKNVSMIIVNAWARPRGEEITAISYKQATAMALEYVFRVINHAGIFWTCYLIPCDLYVFLSVCQRYTDRHYRGRKLAGSTI